MNACAYCIRLRLNKASELTSEFKDEDISENADDELYSLISSTIDLHTQCLE